MGNTAKRDTRTLVRIGRIERTCQLRRENKTLQAIADELGVHKVTVYRYILQAKCWAQESATEAAADLIVEQSRVLDALAATLYEPATRDEPDYEAIDRLLKVLVRKSALLGLDAPRRTALTVAPAEDATPETARRLMAQAFPGAAAKPPE